MKRITKTAQSSLALGPYSLAVEVGGMVEVSGQIALTPQGTIINDDVASEVDQIMANISNILHEIGCDFRNVTFANIYYTKDVAFKEINDAYAKYFDNGYPARATIGVAFLPHPDARIEIAVRATRSN